MNLSNWALRWGIQPEALQDLRVNYLGTRNQKAASVHEDMSENAVSQRTELNFLDCGGILWRNNVGVLPNIKGTPVRYGLANTSSKVNKKTKSGDFIGCLPITIRPDHIGKVFGLFVSLELKKANWVYCGDDRELAQLNWAGIVNSLGGVGMFVNDPEQIKFMGEL